MHLQIPKSHKKFFRSKCIKLQQNFHHKYCEEEPVGFINIKTNKPSIHKDHQIKEVSESSEKENKKEIILGAFKKEHVVQ
jgi:hypothetical protein